MSADVITVEVPVDPDLIVALYPGMTDVVVIKHPQAFGVWVGGREVMHTAGEEDADFAAACAYATAEAARIYREQT